MTATTNFHTLQNALKSNTKRISVAPMIDWTTIFKYFNKNQLFKYQQKNQWRK